MCDFSTRPSSLTFFVSLEAIPLHCIAHSCGTKQCRFATAGALWAAAAMCPPFSGPALVLFPSLVRPLPLVHFLTSLVVAPPSSFPYFVSFFITSIRILHVAVSRVCSRQTGKPSTGRFSDLIRMSRSIHSFIRTTQIFFIPLLGLVSFHYLPR